MNGLKATDEEIARQVINRIINPPIELSVLSLMEAKYQATRGQVWPTHIICGAGAFEKVHNVVRNMAVHSEQPGESYIDQHGRFMFSGMEIQLSENLPADEIYICNSSYIGIQEFEARIRVKL